MAPISSRIRGSIAGVAPLRREPATLLATDLDLHDDGQHHRSALGALVQEVDDAVVDRVLERRGRGARERDTRRGAGDSSSGGGYWGGAAVPPGSRVPRRAAGSAGRKSPPRRA